MNRPWKTNFASAILLEKFKIALALFDCLQQSITISFWTLQIPSYVPYCELSVINCPSNTLTHPHVVSTSRRFFCWWRKNKLLKNFNKKSKGFSEETRNQLSGRYVIFGHSQVGLNKEDLSRERWENVDLHGRSWQRCNAHAGCSLTGQSNISFAFFSCLLLFLFFFFYLSLIISPLPSWSIHQSSHDCNSLKAIHPPWFSRFYHMNAFVYLCVYVVFFVYWFAYLWIFYLLLLQLFVVVIILKIVFSLQKLCL